MGKITYDAVSGMELELKRQEVLANNLAAASVPGYKAEFMVSSQFKREFDEQGSNGVGGGQVKVDFSQGELKNTGRRLDFALQGEGFFKVQSLDGKTMLTRNGAFTLNKEMQLTTDQGFLVLSENDSPIVFLPDDDLDQLEVMPDGTMRMMGPASTNYAYKILNKIGVTQIENKEVLERLTGSYFRIPENAEVKKFDTPQTFAISNATLEMANAAPIKTMVQLIQSSREFEMGNRVMRMLTDIHSRELQSFTQ